jgi:hypothetical protein
MNLSLLKYLFLDYYNTISLNDLILSIQFHEQHSSLFDHIKKLFIQLILHLMKFLLLYLILFIFQLFQKKPQI